MTVAGGPAEGALNAPAAPHARCLSLEPDGEVPNNPVLPVVHYPGVVDAGHADMAGAFEAMFGAHAWPPAWRNGIFGFHHFHTTAHEVLGIYSGTVTVRLGGEAGVDVVLAPGDVVVLPAGVGHKKLGCQGRLGVVGAYPAGQDPDTCRPDAKRFAARAAQVARVPAPVADPVHGASGPLMRYWAS